MKAAWVAVALLLAGCQPDCSAPPEGSLGDPTAWEQAFIAGPGLPALPSIDTLQAEDGLALAYTDWVPDGWDGTGPAVLIVHGSSAYGELYGALGEGLAAAGVLARTIDLRGHGRSTCVRADDCSDPEAPRTYVDDGAYWRGRPGDSRDIEQHTRDLHRHLADMRTRWPDAPIVLAGHSSGAGLVARYVEQVGMDELEGAILLAPFVHPDQPQNDLGSWDCGRAVGTPYALVDVGALGDARRGNVHRYVLDLRKNPAYVTDLDTSRYTYTTLEGLQVHDVDRYHAAFTRPVLWVAGRKDALLDLEISRDEFERLPGGGAFVEVRETSHVGVSWSSGVAATMAAFALAPEATPSSTIDPQ